MTSSFHRTFFEGPYRNLTAHERVSICETWLQDNVGDPNCATVNLFLFGAKELESIDKELESRRSSIESTFGPSFLNKTIDEKVSICETWLKNKEGDSMYLFANEILTAEKIKQRSLWIVLEKYTEKINRSLSCFKWPQNAPHAEVSQTEIGPELFQLVQDSFMSEKFLRTHYMLRGTDVHHEDDCLFEVQLLLEAVIEGLGLDMLITVHMKRSMAGAECDLLLYYEPILLPFAALEIKKPPSERVDRDHLFHGDESKGGNRVAGEIWAEMNGVKLFGFHKVYGMISTFNQFRLVCTDELNEESDNVPAMLKAWEELKKMKQGFECQQEIKKSIELLTSSGRRPVDFGDERGANPEEAKIAGSQIIPNLDDDKKEIVPVEKAGPEILQLVTLFVLKSCTTLTKLLNERGESKNITLYQEIPCRIVRKQEKELSFGSITLTSLNLDVFDNTLQTINVIRHLDTYGGRSNCCLGVSDCGGSSCVVKFYCEGFRPLMKEYSKDEYQNWKQIYGKTGYGPPMAQRFKLSEGHCLVMPYLKPIPESERYKLLRKHGKMSRIEETLRKFAKSGYIHTDLRWHHFGIWHGELFLLDLAKVVKVEKNEIDGWVAEALEHLREKAVKPETQVTPKNARKRKASVSSTRAKDGGDTAAVTAPSLAQGRDKRQRVPNPKYYGSNWAQQSNKKR